MHLLRDRGRGSSTCSSPTSPGLRRRPAWLGHDSGLSTTTTGLAHDARRASARVLLDDHVVSAAPSPSPEVFLRPGGPLSDRPSIHLICRRPPPMIPTTATCQAGSSRPPTLSAVAVSLGLVEARNSFDPDLHSTCRFASRPCPDRGKLLGPLHQMAVEAEGPPLVTSRCHPPWSTQYCST